MIQLIVNPVAGNGRAKQVGRQMAERLAAKEVPFAMVETEHQGHATDLARAAVEAGYTTAVAVGGDGTILEVVRGLHGGQTALGIVPAGTGNDVVKMLGTPAAPQEALDFLLKTPPRPLDAGRINDSLFLNVSGTGFDVCVLDVALSAKRYVSGLLPYLWGVIRTIFTYHPIDITITIDEEAPITRKLLLLSIANGRFIGGGMEVAPDARPNDGLFDVVLIDAMPRRSMPFQLPKLLSGKIRQIPGTRYSKCRRVEMRASGMRVNIDGEIIPMDHAILEILPDALLAHW